MRSSIKVPGIEEGEFDIVKIGDYVGWKADYEQSGKVKGIHGSTIMISCYDDNSGEELTEWVDASDCWKE